MRSRSIEILRNEEILQSFSVLIDKREQDTERARKRYKAFSVPYDRATLDYGDYTCFAVSSQNGAFSLAEKYVIERKANVDELVGNFTKGRERFDREFKRAAADQAKVFLLIEDANLWRTIREHRYRSKMPPKSLLATLCSWQARYNITVISCSREDSGTLIKAILWYALRDELKGVGDDGQ